MPYAAFEQSSRSGKFIREIADTIQVPSVEIGYDNLIPGPVFDTDGTERNPTVKELSDALDGHPIWEASDIDVVVGLSSSVQSALEAAQRRRVARGHAPGPKMVFAHHPSFMMRRPKEERARYRTSIKRQVSEAVAALSA